MNEQKSHVVKNNNGHQEIIQAPHAYDSSLVLQAFATTEEGLSEAEVKTRQSVYGVNSLPVTPPTPSWKRFVLQFHNVLIYILIVSALISFLLQHYLDSGVILAVIVINAIVGFVQEGKAEQALMAIRSMSRTRCLVVRDGISVNLDSVELVPGDIVTVQAGDRVPADIRLYFCKNLQCDESALTGESQTVEKQCDSLALSASLAERNNMVFMGTMVSFGLARGIVCRTGIETEIGAISELVQTAELSQTPLQKQLKYFAQQLSMAIILIAAASMIFGILLHSYSIADMFQAAISIAVASIPEGLPAIVTIALAIGVQRMVKRKALVRHLPSVEVLGSVDVICSDKTGTLTSNEMTTREVIHAAGHYKVSGDGYRPEGDITDKISQKNISSGQDKILDEAILVAMLCNDANLTETEDNCKLHGDPTEGALLVLALKQGLDRESINETWPRIDELPFETERRYMATLHSNAEELKFLAVKGAPDRLLEFCDTQAGLNGTEPLQYDFWNNGIRELAEKGMRVMALARKEIPLHTANLEHSMVESRLTLLALIGISDPPRADAIASIQACHNAGITVKMITGDNPVTARAIGNELGLNTDRVLTGVELDRLTLTELTEAVTEVDVFARTSPANKLQLVDALRKSGHVVAMTGDGVNDAPALKEADIGVAMGRKGTDAAKEASDIVLTDDRFSTIASAVEEGRTVYDNILKSIIFILPTSLAEAGVIIIAVVVGLVLPVTPAQILWINLVTTVTLDLALAFEGPEPGIMNRPPREKGQRLITKPLFSRIVLVSLYAIVIVFWLFNHYLNSGSSIELARTIVVNTLVLIEAIYLINCRFLYQSIFSRSIFKGFVATAAAIASMSVIQLIYSYLPISQQIFGLESMGVMDWVLIASAALPILFVVEVEKFIWRLLRDSGKVVRQADKAINSAT